ncbi:hypothetical protein D3C87_1921550 [compost metagenome]
MTAPGFLARSPVVSSCSNFKAPGPETSRRFSGVMSYMATAVRVFQASAAAMGELNIPDHASRAGGCQSSGISLRSSALASNQYGRSHPAPSRK